MLLTLLQSAGAVNDAQIVGSIDLTATVTAKTSKKTWSGGRSRFKDTYAARLKLARMDERDLLDIVTIVAFALSSIDA